MSARAWIILLMMAAAATAQPAATAPVTRPVTTRPAQRSAEEMLRQMLQPAGQGAQPLKPIAEIPQQTDATSGEGATAPAASTQPLEREGSLVLDRVGRISRGKDSKWLEFSFVADGRSLTDPPALLLPNRQLMRLEDLLRNSYADLTIRILSGELTEYRGRNYLLIHRWTQVADLAQPLK